MCDVGEQLTRIRMGALLWEIAFEDALEAIVIRHDRSTVRLRTMRPEERGYRTSGPLSDDDDDEQDEQEDAR